MFPIIGFSDASKGCAHPSVHSSIEHWWDFCLLLARLGSQNLLEIRTLWSTASMVSEEINRQTQACAECDHVNCAFLGSQVKSKPDDFNSERPSKRNPCEGDGRDED